MKSGDAGALYAALEAGGLINKTVTVNFLGAKTPKIELIPPNLGQNACSVLL